MTIAFGRARERKRRSTEKKEEGRKEAEAGPSTSHGPRHCDGVWRPPLHFVHSRCLTSAKSLWPVFCGSRNSFQRPFGLLFSWHLSLEPFSSISASNPRFGQKMSQSYLGNFGEQGTESTSSSFKGCGVGGHKGTLPVI